MNKILLTLALIGLVSTTSFGASRRRTAFFETKTAQGDQTVLDFVRGFLVGVRLNQYNSQISGCLQLGETQALLSSAFEHLKTETLVSLLVAVTEVGTAAQIIPDAFDSCGIVIPETVDLQAAITLFQSPESLDFYDKSLWVNGFEVFPQLYLARAAVERGGRNAWYLFGKYIAKGLVHVALGPDDTLDGNFAEYLNAQSSYDAELNPAFEGMSLREIASALAGTLIEDNFDAVPDPVDVVGSPEYILAQQTIPASYDWRTTFSNCVRPVRDQGYCGCCWAFATTSALSDRICTNMTSSGSASPLNVDLSTQFSTSCDTAEFGCNGGYLSKSWKFFESTGALSESCNPYLSYDGISPANYTCAAQCTADNQKYYAWTGTTVKSGTVTAIKTSIFKYGPITCSMIVYEDFYYYKSGIYRYVSGANTGGHAVKIVGWGVDATTGVNFWIVQNSWSATWGENGYFRIAQGQASIENGCYAAVADIVRSGK